MKKRLDIGILILLIVGLIAFSLVLMPQKRNKSQISSPVAKTSNPNDTYLKSYAGGYMIQINGIPQGNSTEMYVLHPTGKAEWKFIEVNGASTNILSEKSGSWNATNSTITITINGNTGAIEEKYEMKDGKFRFGDRILLKVS